MEGVLIGGLAGLLCAMTLRLIKARTRKEATFSNGRYVLDYGISMKAAAVSTSLFACFLLINTVHESLTESDQVTGAWTLTVITVPAFCSLLFEAFGVTISFDDHAIYTRSPWRKQRTIPWSDVQSVDFSQINQWHLIRTANQDSVRLSVMLQGSQTLLNELRERNIRFS